tara:strand:- start:23 stop:241 length:219 start_codon:yes stop_codon:yes gene_type:complete
MTKIKLKSIEDCKELIAKRVSFNYGKHLRSGIVKSFEQEGRKIYFQILSDMTQGITHIDMWDLTEVTDKIIK